MRPRTRPLSSSQADRRRDGLGIARVSESLGKTGSCVCATDLPQTPAALSQRQMAHHFSTHRVSMAFAN